MPDSTLTEAMEEEAGVENPLPEKAKEKLFQQEDGFILPMFFRIFRALSYVSLFWVIRQIDLEWWAHKHPGCRDADGKIALPSRDEFGSQREWTKAKPVTRRYVFPEAWALGNLILAILAGTCGYLVDWFPFQVIMFVYAFERTLELFVYQVNVLLFDPLINSHNYKIKSATRMVILLVMNMIEYTFWFSCLYSCAGVIFEGMQPESFIFVLESFNYLTNLSSPDQATAAIFQVLAFLETLVGMFMNLVCLARFIGLLPDVERIDRN